MAKYPDPCTKRIWCRAGRYTAGGNSRKYIVVHNTANTASAVNEANNLHNNSGKSSFHYTIDDHDVIQCVHDYDTAWAVGAWKGATAYIRNNESISIEVCNAGTEFSAAEKEKLRALVLHLMEYYNIPASRVVRHWDCHSGRKSCPAFYAGSNNSAWNALHSYITGGSSSVPSGGGSASGSSGSSGGLAVDGYWGKSTTLKAQQVAGAPYKDGLVSRQNPQHKGRMPGCTGGWEWKLGNGSGSQLIKLLQKKWGAPADGIMGPDTINAMIGYYMARGSGAKVKDGRLDAKSPTIKQFQRELNQGRI